MKKTLEQVLQEFDYQFPSHLIATKPASPRDSAKLLIYNKKKKTTSYSTFSKIVNFIPKNAVLVFNETKVWPARLFTKKASGGTVQILYTKTEKGFIYGLSNKKLEPKTVLYITKGITLTPLKKEGSEYIFKPSFASTDIKKILTKYGKTPLPPYIKNPPLSERKIRSEYQTVFAKKGLSVAAPTASLHFTKKTIAQLKKHGVQIAFVTLNVGLGTFKPLTEENLKTQQLHEEYYEIPKATQQILQSAINESRPIIAVGTTVVRTLESAYKNSKICTKPMGNTKLFIQPGYTFKIVRGLITNFHVPKSSLLMLVSAFTKKSILLELYKKAIKQKFRLFSFGDGMLIL